MVGSQNRLVEEDITALNVDMSGSSRTLDGGRVVLSIQRPQSTPQFFLMCVVGASARRPVGRNRSGNLGC